MSVEDKLDELILQFKILNQILITHARNEIITNNEHMTSEQYEDITKEGLRLLNGELNIDDAELMEYAYGDAE